MKWLPTDKNSIALILVNIVVIGFFVAGLFDVLDYLIIKFLIISGTLALLLTAFYFARRNRKNRLEDKL